MKTKGNDPGQGEQGNDLARKWEIWAKLGRDPAPGKGNDPPKPTGNDQGRLHLEGRKCLKIPSKRRPDPVTKVDTGNS